MTITDYKYVVEIKAGRMYLGNALCNSFDECMKFAIADGFATKAIITEQKTKKKFVVTFESEE